MGLSPWIESKAASSTQDAIGQHYKYKKEEKNTGRNSSAITIKVSPRGLAGTASSRKDENANKKFQRCGLHHVLQNPKGVQEGKGGLVQKEK